MVCGAIASMRRTELRIIQHGSLTAVRYRDEILGSHVVPMAATIGLYLILMDDNARPHRA